MRVRETLPGIMVFLVITFSALALGGHAAAAAKGDATGVSDKSIKIGYIGDMTGPATSATVPYRRGLSDYFDYINKEKGGINGRQIEFIPEDDKFTVPLAITAFRKLVDRDEVFAIVGMAGSSQTAALAPDIEKMGIPVFGPQQTGETELKNPHFFTTAPSYFDQCGVMVNYALDQLEKQGKKPQIAVAIVKVASGYEFLEYSKDILGKKGQKIIGHVEIAPNALEAAAQIKEMKDLNPNWVLHHGTPATFVLDLKEAHRYGLQVPTTNTTGAVSDHIYETVGKEASKEFWGVQGVSPSWMEGPGIEELGYVNKKYGNPEHLGNLWYIMSYTAAKAFVEGLQRAGRDLTRQSFMAAVETLTNFDTGGLSAPFKFGPGDHHGSSALRMYGYDFDTKRIVPLSDWIEP